MKFEKATVAGIKTDVIKGEITLSFKVQRTNDSDQEAERLGIYADPDNPQKMDIVITPHQLPLRTDKDYQPPKNPEQDELQLDQAGFIKPIMFLEGGDTIEGEVAELDQEPTATPHPDDCDCEECEKFEQELKTNIDYEAETPQEEGGEEDAR